MYSEDEHGNVTLTMTRDDFGNLLLALGIATAHLIGDDPLFQRQLALVNRVNDGNPNWTPYELEQDVT